MKFEHFAYNVTDPVAMSRWYCANLGLELARQGAGPDFTTFLRDPETGVMIELYHQSPAPIPDYGAQHPLTLHLAFAPENPDQTLAALLAAGAECLSDRTLDDGTRLIMMRDPFGVCLQFCKRAKGFFA